MTAATLNQAPAGTTPERRHRWLNTWCALLDDILTSNAADELRPPTQRAGAALVRLPNFCWRRPGHDVGRKDRGAGEERLLLPARLHWSSGPLLLVPADSTADVRWSTIGLGVHETGTTTVRARANGHASPAPAWPDTPPDEVAAQLLNAADLHTQLEATRRLGRPAEVQAMLLLEPMVEREVRAAHTHIVSDVQLPNPSAEPGLRLLDDSALDTCVQNLVFGLSDRPGEQSLVQKLIRRSLDEAAFEHVDPLRFCRRTLHKEAKREVQRMVGDPLVGSIIRSVARKLQLTEAMGDAIDKLVEACREAHPHEDIGPDRVLAALTIHPFTISSFDDDDVAGAM